MEENSPQVQISYLETICTHLSKNRSVILVRYFLELLRSAVLDGRVKLDFKEKEYSFQQPVKKREWCKEIIRKTLSVRKIGEKTPSLRITFVFRTFCKEGWNLYSQSFELKHVTSLTICGEKFCEGCSDYIFCQGVIWHPIYFLCRLCRYRRMYILIRKKFGRDLAQMIVVEVRNKEVVNFGTSYSNICKANGGTYLALRSN